MSFKQKRMAFEAVCHAKNQEFSLDFVLNAINVTQKIITLHKIAYVDDIDNQISFWVIPMT